MTVLSLEVVRATFTQGLAIPAHLRLLRDGKPVDLRGEARRKSAFWERFQHCAFAHAEMQAAIRRSRAVPEKQRGVLVQKVTGFAQVPEQVGDEFKRLFDAFEQVTMGICRDPECADVSFKHAHAYQRATAIQGATFRTTSEARSWVTSGRGRGIISGLNALALDRRTRDWPGMPDALAPAPEATTPTYA